MSTDASDHLQPQHNAATEALKDDDDNHQVIFDSSIVHNLSFTNFKNAATQIAGTQAHLHLKLFIHPQNYP